MGFVMVLELKRQEFTLSTDQSKLDIAFIHDYLCNQSYWAEGRDLETVKKSIQNSVCFGVFNGNQQVGFARVVTDYSTFAWLCDVFIVEDHQGMGLGKWMIESVVKYPDLEHLKIMLLATRDAHDLYRKYGGFDKLEIPSKWMIRRSNVDTD
jgi:GNAT superfamily N-acetyltransferase